MIPPPQDRSLAWKTFRPLALAALALFGVGAVGIYWAVGRHQESSARRHALSIARAMGSYAESFADQEGLQRMVFTAAAEPGVTFVLIAGGREETILAAAPSDWIGHAAPARQSAAALLRTLAPAVFAADPLVASLALKMPGRDSLRNYPARVIIGMDSGPVRQAARQTAWLSIAAYGLTLSALLGYTLRVLRREVFAPLENLTRCHLPVAPQTSPSDQTDEISLLDATLRSASRDLSAAYASRDRLRIAHERFACAVSLDREGRIVDASPRFAALVGQSREHLVGTDYRQLLADAEPADDLPAAFARTTPDGDSWHGELRFATGSGLRWLAVNALPLGDQEDSGAILLHHDVTALKSVEVTLRRLSARLAAAEALAHLGGWDLQPDGSFHWSGELLRLHGLTSTTSRSPQALFELYTPADAARLGIAFERALAHGEQFDLVCRLLRENGSTRWVRLCGLPKPGEPGLITGFAQDVTASHEAELALRTAENRLQSIVRYQRDLVCRFLPDGTITFVNPPYCRFFGQEESRLLGASFYHVLPERFRETARAQIARLLTDKRSGERITQETHTAEGRRVVIEWQTTLFFSDHDTVSEILALGADVTDRLRAENALRDIERELENLLEAGVDPFCLTDLEGRILRANRELADILGHSRTALEGRLLTDLIVRDDAPSLRAALSGLGEDKAEIQLPLRHTDPNAPALLWHLRRCDRRIYAGARAKPRPSSPAPPPEPVAQSAVSTPFTPTTHPSSGRVLLAEDNPINQQVVTGLLARIGLRPDVVDHGQAALDALTARDYDLVLMDIQMPVLDGLAATRALRASPPGARPDPTTPVVGLTAHALPQDRAAGLAAGLNDYLTKPISPQILFDVVQRFTRTHQSPPPTPAEPALPPPASALFIDQTELLRRFLGDEALARRILPKFRAQLEQAGVSIGDALRNNDREKALRELHNLKGAARNLSARPLAAAIEALESSLRSGADCAHAAKSFLQSVTDTVAALELPTISPPPPP